MAYLTPDRFRVMGFGVDLTDLSDADFAFAIERASSLVDTYCNVPVIPSKHDFRGGVVAGEQHRWRLPDPTMMVNEVGTRRVYPFHGPLRSVTSFKVMFTENYQIEVDPANLYVNQSENWAEVVSLAAVVSGIYPVGVSFGLYTPVAVINYTYGYRFTSTDETLIPDDSGAYDGSAYRANEQYWAADATPIVKKNGVVQTSGYTVNKTEGLVIFNTLLEAEDKVTCTYVYTLPSAIRDATGYILADVLAERELYQRGMGRLGQIRIAEMEIRRQDTYNRRVSEEGGAIPPEARALLAPYRFISAR